MGFNVVPSPEVSGLTGAPGPQGLKGDVGSSILTGTTAPLSATGADGDWYFMEDTRTFLGVTSTTFTIYKKAAGAWSVVGSTLGGSKWYVNTASTSSTDTKPGDMLLRTDTGDIWQRSASGWGSPIGNIRGPQGIQGIQGIQGVAGPQGPEGPQGVQGPQGPAGTQYVFRGGWAAGVAYATNDFVRYDGSTYRVTTAHTSTAGNTPDVTTGYYAMMAQKGDTGPAGPEGPQGPAGAEGPQGPAGADGAGAVDSVNGKVGAVVLTPADIGAVDPDDATFNDFMVINATTDTTYGIVAMRKLNKKRWSFMVTGASETGGNVGSNFLLQSYNDDETDKTTHIYADRETGNTTIGGTSEMNGARLNLEGGALGIQNQAADPTSSSLGSHFYSKAGRPWVKRGSGASPGGALAFELQPRPDEFLPEDLGLKAWTGDPAACVSTGAFCGSGPLRIAAVNLRQAQSISKIAWHFLGYAGGLQTGSWAAVFNTSGTRMAYTNDISTAGNEPAEQHGSGGGTSFVPLTATWSATPGIYYIAWRFIYNTTTGDGPMCLQYENSAGAPPNVFGLGTPVKRFGYFPSTSATPPTSIAVANMENGANRFWAALA
ncbi:minor tail protein [Streptomyces phage Endor1]|uniref:Minor tail protein n=1 Tax=Streptomyces phage Endor1 TaxID=2740181 RepID=A0A7G4AWT6_9CAUD|nr:minor tail protein [Streptomyces phage Endor1]QMP84476.1 minor tail protein [Streptomyces phage Endor1]